MVATRKKAAPKTTRKKAEPKTKKPDKTDPKKTAVRGKGKTVVQRIEIPKIELGLLEVTVVGTSPLIQHRFGVKKREQIARKQEGKIKEKTKRDPKAEYLDSMYVVKGKAGARGAKYGIPAAAFKNAIVGACRYIDGLPMTLCRGVVFVLGPREHPDFTLIECKDGPVMRTDTVVLQGPSKPADLRYRAMFPTWSTKLLLSFDAGLISAEQVVNLINRAGFHVGVQEWRPERSGIFGRFEVDQRKLKLTK